MIHAYLFVTEGKNHKMGHGPQFREHMTRINKLHGSKITVFHNFRKEVDKFRVHVYRCDGPCTKQRPYFGVLRRAISRPPGPTDRWWAKHSQECGGTFRKVEGPDISPDVTHITQPLGSSPGSSSGSPSLKDQPLGISRAIPPGTPYPKHTPSSRRMDSPVTPSSGAKGSGARRDESKFMSGVSKRLNFSEEKATDNTASSEDLLVQKIKKRHAHASRSILLSKEETRMKWRGPSPERGTLVEGRVNYNYRIKSGFKFNIGKYLARYRLAKEGEAKASQMTEVSQSPQASQNTQKFLRLQPTGAHTSRTEKIMVPQASRDNIPCSSVDPNTSGNTHATVPPLVVCWNCGVNVMVPQHVQHLQKEEKKEGVCDTPKITPQVRKENSEVSVSSALVPCPSCGLKIPQEEINSHLDECLAPFTDDF